MGVEWFWDGHGLGFVLSFGYWCTDFLVVQRAMAADSMSAARRTPLIAAVPKMFFPMLVILPGMIAIALTYHAAGSGFQLPKKPDGTFNYDMAIPTMLIHYFPTGMLGVGLTALMASFMSGMAGNVTAFNTVWTYDIYHAYIYRHGSDQLISWWDVWRRFSALLFRSGRPMPRRSSTTSWICCKLVFAFVNAPLFATFSVGHVLETHHGSRRLLWLISRHAGRGSSPWVSRFHWAPIRESTADGWRNSPGCKFRMSIRAIWPKIFGPLFLLGAHALL